MRVANREQLLANAAEGLVEGRDHALAILERAVAAVDPSLVVGRSLLMGKDKVLTVRGDPFAGGPGSAEDLRFALPKGAVRCLAAGKASVGMLGALAGVMDVEEAVAVAPSAEPHGFEVLRGGHPLPDADSVRAGQRALAMARATGPDDLLLVLLSGGASAMMDEPLVPLEDLRALTDLLLGAGATIEEMNAVRKKLSDVKGGRLAAATRGQVLTLMLSDCLEDHPGTVASGPTAPDATTHGDALSILRALGLAERAPPSVVRVLEQGAAGQRPETPKPGDPLFQRVRNVVIGSNALAAHEATLAGTELGYHAFRVREPLRGPAARAGWKLARMAEDVTLGKAPLPRPACIVYGGETTVDLRSAKGALGKGGRNQEMALAALETLKVEATIACMGTDGRDGPTDAAGAIVDMGSKERAQALGLDARDHLARHDSHAFFAQLGDLLVTGPTGTNVADVAVLLVP